MILLKINDIKDMMSLLLLQDTFDGFLLEEARITTSARIVYQGKRNMEWYDGEERDSLPEYLWWREARPFVFAYMKGKKTPSRFQISLRLSREAAGRLEVQELAGEADYLLHFRFEQGRLSLVTGCFQHSFSLDRRAEFAWDEAAEALLRELHIGFEAG